MMFGQVPFDLFIQHAKERIDVPFGQRAIGVCDDCNVVDHEFSSI
jgi:hypothetical protein